MAVREHLGDEPMFLANYADGLSDMPLPDMIDFHERNDAVASFMSIRPRQSFHTVGMNQNGCVQNVTAVTDADVWINGGFFVLDQRIFDYMRPGDELVEKPFQRLIQTNGLFAYRHEGFFGCMDTFKEKQELDDMHHNGNTPWMVWNHPSHNAWGDTRRLANEVLDTLEGITVAAM
jgi:glucose-1-phosphate cytidylyltransferase